MNYGKILSRAINIVWEHKFLILLGILVALGSGTGSNASFNFGGSSDQWQFDPGTQPQFPETFPEFPRTFPNGPDMPWEAVGVAAPVVIGLIILALTVGLLVWAVSTIARGGLIAGVDTIESGGSSSFRQAWGAGWRKGWTLIGIGILPAIPGLLLVLAGFILTGGLVLIGRAFEVVLPAGNALFLVGIIAVCIALPLSLGLGLLRTFANRACMLEDVGVFAAYRRGFAVLMENLGPAILLFLLQIAASLAIGILLFIPGVFAALCCCLLWPVLIAFNGGFAATFSSMWTLAWREWTGRTKLAPKATV